MRSRVVGADRALSWLVYTSWEAIDSVCSDVRMVRITVHAFWADSVVITGTRRWAIEACRTFVALVLSPLVIVLSCLAYLFFISTIISILIYCVVTRPCGVLISDS